MIDLETLYYREIKAERAAQDREWGGPAHDDQHQWADWTDFISKQGALAATAVDRSEFIRRMVKVAALAVAAIESETRKAGATPMVTTKAS